MGILYDDRCATMYPFSICGDLEVDSLRGRELALAELIHGPAYMTYVPDPLGLGSRFTNVPWCPKLRITGLNFFDSLENRGTGAVGEAQTQDLMYYCAAAHGGGRHRVGARMGTRYHGGGSANGSPMSLVRRGRCAVHSIRIGTP